VERGVRPESGRAAVALLLLLTATAFYAAIARGTLVFGDDVLQFQVTEAIFERGQVSVTAPADPDSPTRSVVGVDGRRYSKYGIGLPLAALPLYAAGRGLERGGFVLPATRDAEGNLRTGTRVLLVCLTDALVGGATVAVLFLLATAAGFSLGAAAAVAAALGFATVFAHSTTTFLAEPLSALALTAALWTVVEAERRASTAGGGGALRPRTPALLLGASGLASGLAFAARASNLVAVAPLAVYVLLTARGFRSRATRVASLAAWSVGFAAWIGVVAVYDLARFGSVFETGYGAEALDFSTPLARGIAGLLVSPGRGLIWFAPPVLLALAGWPALRRRNARLAATAAAMGVALLVLAAKFYQWHGGGVWGPRLLVPVLPVLLLSAAEVFERLPSAPGERAAGGRRRPARRWGLGAAVAGCLGGGALTVALVVLVPFDRYVEVVWHDPRDLHAPALEASLWRPSASPLVVHARALPTAIARTARLVAGLEPMPDAAAKRRPGLPDLAFARYGSHALLQGFRLAALAALAAAVLCAMALRRRDPGCG
jgi:hypothetical protein